MAIFPAFWIVIYVAIWFTQIFYVTPNEFSKESKYIEYNLASTKQAYNLNTEEFKFMPGDIDSATFDTNSDIIGNLNIIIDEFNVKPLTILARYL